MTITNRTVLSDKVRSSCLLLLIAWLLGAIAWSGFTTGTDEILAGPMSRSRDSIAIAQSYLRDMKWKGFAAYKEVLLELDRRGLTLDERLAAQNFGSKDYQSFLRQTAITNSAIKAAREVEIKQPEQLWFVDGDDFGLASYFILAFTLFGDNVSSLFYLYLSILGLTVVAFSLQFWRQPELLMTALLFLIAIHILLFVTLGITPDVNAIDGGRFLPVLGQLGTLHLILLMMLRIRANPVTIALCIVQVLVILFVIHIRPSGMWMAIAVLFAGMLIIAVDRRKALVKDHTVQTWGTALTRAWPLAALIILFSLGAAVVNVAQHPRYKDPRALDRHIFWHSFITVLHNNPARTEVFGIQKTPELDPRGDGISFYLFERHIREKGLNRADLVSHDGERNRLVGVDLLWSRYDAVLRDVFWESVRKEPIYALSSFFYYQPLEIARATAGTFKRNALTILSASHFVPFLLAALLFPARHSLALGMSLAVVLGFSFIPTMVVAPHELRVMEPFVMLLITAEFLAACGIHRILEALSSPRRTL